jgi:hypothetical protein
MTEPARDHEADRVRFRRTLIRVMTMQLVALLLLWWLQSAFTP